MISLGKTFKGERNNFFSLPAHEKLINLQYDDLTAFWDDDEQWNEPIQTALHVVIQESVLCSQGKIFISVNGCSLFPDITVYTWKQFTLCSNDCSRANPLPDAVYCLIL